MTNLLDKYNRGLITRGEYLGEAKLSDISPNKVITKMTSLAQKHQWKRLIGYAESLKAEEAWMVEDIIDMANDNRNLWGDPIKHPADLQASFEGLLENIGEFKFPVPIS